MITHCYATCHRGSDTFRIWWWFSHITLIRNGSPVRINIVRLFSDDAMINFIFHRLQVIWSFIFNTAFHVAAHHLSRAPLLILLFRCYFRRYRVRFRTAAIAGAWISLCSQHIISVTAISFPQECLVNLKIAYRQYTKDIRFFSALPTFRAEFRHRHRPLTDTGTKSTFRFSERAGQFQFIVDYRWYLIFSADTLENNEVEGRCHGIGLLDSFCYSMA